MSSFEINGWQLQCHMKRTIHVPVLVLSANLGDFSLPLITGEWLDFEKKGEEEDQVCVHCLLQYESGEVHDYMYFGI